MRLSDLDELARRQFGVVRRDQVPVGPSAWYRAIDRGHLVPVHPNVVRLVGTETGELQRIKAATLAAPTAVASHRSAAYLWGLVASVDARAEHSTDRHRTTDDRVHLTGLGETFVRRISGVMVHRPDDRRDVRPVVRRSIPCTPPLRTLLDLGITDSALVEDAVGTALSTGLLTIAGLEAGLRRHAARGRTGVTALRAAIDHWAIDAVPADSVLEVAFSELCCAFELPTPVFHDRLEGWEVDFRFDGTPIVVECDGWTTHGRRRDQFERDRRKDDDLRAAGWIVARFSYRAITQRRSDTARRIRRLLDRWGATGVPAAPAG